MKRKQNKNNNDQKINKNYVQNINDKVKVGFSRLDGKLEEHEKMLKELSSTTTTTPQQDSLNLVVQATSRNI